MFKSQKELMQALMEGKKIRKDIWWSHCYLKMDEDGMIYDEEDHLYKLDMDAYSEFRIITNKDYVFMKEIMNIDLNKLSCVSEDISCGDCPLYVNEHCVKGGLMDMVDKCQKYLEE